MSRQRRRRVQGEGETGAARKEETADERESKVMFMEEVDYKMEVEHHEAKRVLVKKEEFSEEERREAFKKKLRKYSGKVKPEDYQELP